ncbi:type II secretion system minor pseudopilin GspI [Thalassotalea agariperforans]
MLSTQMINRGFTLIEVMLAMAIFSIAGVALLATATTNFTNLSLLEEKMLANWVASNQLVEAKLTESWPPRNNKKGEEELAGQTWFWQQKVIKTTDNDLRALSVEVRKNEKDEKAIISLLTYVSKVN